MLVELHRYDEGREAYQRSLKLKRTKLGAEHRSVLVTQINLAVLEERLGNFAAAEVGIDEVHQIRLKRFGDNYPQLPSTLEARAWVSTKLGKLAEAATFARRSGDLYRARGDDARESAAWADVTLCNILRLQRKLAEARRVCGAAIKSLRDKGQDPRTLASTLSYAAHVELEARRTKQALEFVEKKLRRFAPSTRAKTPTLPIRTWSTHALWRRTRVKRRELPRSRSSQKAALETLHVGDRHLLAADIEAL